MAGIIQSQHLPVISGVAEFGNGAGVCGEIGDSVLGKTDEVIEQGADHITEILASLSDQLVLEPNFLGLSNLREFLLTLTDPDVSALPQLRPHTVPSGLDPP